MQKKPFVINFAVVKFNLKNLMIMKKTILLLCAFMAATGAMAQSGAKFLQGETVTQNRNVSPNGKYVVGGGTLDKTWGLDNIRGFDSYIWDTETDVIETVTTFGGQDDYADAGYLTDVNDDKVICGYFKDDNYKLTMTELGYTNTLPLNVAAVWKDGQRTSLGLGGRDVSDFEYFFDGSFATAISNDSKTVVGYIGIGNLAQMYPCAWVLDETTGEYEYKEYAMPEGAIRARIADVSGDGSIAVGWGEYTGDNVGTKACIWFKPDSCVIVEDPDHVYGDQLKGRATCISPNGQFVGMTLNGSTPVLYYTLSQNPVTNCAEHQDDNGADITVTVQGVADNGEMIGVYEYRPYGFASYNRPFWYTRDYNTTTDFDYYVYLYAYDVEMPYTFMFESQEYVNFVALSADARTFVGNDVYGAPWILKTDYTKMKDVLPTVESVNTQITGPGEVTVSVPKYGTDAYMGYDLYEYVFYRDGEKIASIANADIEAGTETLITVDKGLKGGTHYYTAAIVWKSIFDETTMEAPKADRQAVRVSADFGMPFFDNFDSGSPVVTYWTYQRDYGDEGQSIFGAPQYLGINSTCALYNAFGHTEPYSYSVVSRHIDATEKESVYLSFARKWMYINSDEWELDKDTVSIEVSTDGKNWTVVKDLMLNEIPSNWWGYEFEDISALAAGKLFQVRIHGHGQGKAMAAWMFDLFKVGETPEHEAPTGVFGVCDENGAFDMRWKNSIDAYPLTYLVNPYGNVQSLAIGNEGKPITAAIEFTPDQLAIYKGKYLTSVTTFINHDFSAGDNISKANLVIYEDDNLVREQEINVEPNVDLVVKLDEPLAIDASKNLRIGIKLTQHDANQIPLAYQNTIDFVPGKSDLYSEDDGATWQKLSDYFATVEGQETDGYACWEITANITDEPQASDKTFSINRNAFEVYRNGSKITPSFVYLLEPGYVDEESTLGDTYEVRAFYLDGTVSELSAPVKNDGTTGISDIEAAGRAEGYTIEDGKLTVDGDNARVEIYNASGSKVYDGAGRGVSLDGFGHGLFILKVYGEDGTSETRKLMF